MMQAIGRLRANRRPNEQLEVVSVSDFDLGFSNIEQVKASTITINAADKFERFKLAATQAIAQLKAAGEKVTQTAVSRITGYSQQYLSRSWDLLLLLMDNLYSKSSKKSNAPPDIEEVPEIDVVRSVLEACTAELLPSELPESIEDLFFQTVPTKYWRVLLSNLSDRAKFALLDSLLPLVSLRELDAIAS